LKLNYIVTNEIGGSGKGLDFLFDIFYIALFFISHMGIERYENCYILKLYKKPNDISRRAFMKCARCGGKMNYEKFYTTSEEFFGWRCIFCGEIIDQVILENRMEQSR